MRSDRMLKSKSVRQFSSCYGCFPGVVQVPFFGIFKTSMFLEKHHRSCNHLSGGNAQCMQIYVQVWFVCKKTQSASYVARHPTTAVHLRTSLRPACSHWCAETFPTFFVQLRYVVCIAGMPRHVVFTIVFGMSFTTSRPTLFKAMLGTMTGTLAVDADNSFKRQRSLNENMLMWSHGSLKDLSPFPNYVFRVSWQFHSKYRVWFYHYCCLFSLPLRLWRAADVHVAVNLSFQLCVYYVTLGSWQSHLLYLSVDCVFPSLPACLHLRSRMVFSLIFSSTAFNISTPKCCRQGHARSPFVYSLSCRLFSFLVWSVRAC